MILGGPSDERHARRDLGVVWGIRLLEPIGYLPSAEYEARYHDRTPAA
jgi:hypothetical protein